MFNRNQPLGLPTGSVRAILALLIVAPIAAVILRSNITFTSDQVIGLASLVLSAYFIVKAAASSTRGGGTE
jgi:hypothetical protein